MDNNQSNDHPSYIVICNNLHNIMKNDNQISNLMVGLLLKLKEVINFPQKNNLIFENLSKRIDNYQNLFTNLKDKNIIILNEPPKIINKDLKKRKNRTYEKQTRYPGNDFDIKKLKKKNHLILAIYLITLLPVVLQKVVLE